MSRGVGMAATGLGLGPARMMHDGTQYTRIMRSASTFGLPTRLLSARRHLSSPLLGEAILFSGETARVWFEYPLSRAPYPSDPPGPPTGIITLLLGLGALMFHSVRRITRDLSRLSALRTENDEEELAHPTNAPKVQ